MADEQREGHPILVGLIAMVAVTLSIGAILGVAALVGSRAAGLDGASAGTSKSASQTLYLPTPSPTGTPTGPNVTIAPGHTQTIPTGAGSVTASPATQISLTSSMPSYPAGSKVDLSGTYPAGEGAELQVQRMEGDTWEPFAGVTTGVSGGVFSTYIITTRVGEAQFRMYDPTTDRSSNVLTLTIG